MLPLTNGAPDPVDAIARFRFAALGRASGILEQERLSAPDGDPLREVAGLLATSLEELKVAEEELRAQNAALLKERVLIESQVIRYRDLFMQSPAAAIVTDLHGVILELNLAGSRLIRRNADLVVRKPLAALIATKGRDEFRRKLSRVPGEGSPRDWRFMMNRSNDVPVEVCATVKRIDGVPGESSRLYWLLSAPQDSGAKHVWDFDGATDN